MKPLFRFSRRVATGWGLLLFVATAPTSPQAAPWVSLGVPPQAERIYGLDANRNGVYISCGQGDNTPLGVWRLPVGSIDWESMGLVECDPLDIQVSGLDQKTLVASCYAGPSGSYSSMDGGVTWQPGGAGIVQGDFLVDLGVDEQAPNVIYALSVGPNWSHGIYSSTDLGSNWSRWDFGNSVGSWYAIQPIPGNNQVAYALFLGQWLLMFKTTNGGLDWFPDPDSPVTQEDYTGDLAVSLSHPNAIFVLASGEPAKVIENSQGTWAYHCLPLTHYWKTLEIPFWAPQNLYVAGIDGDHHLGVRKSTNLGATWTGISEGLPDTQYNPGVVLAIACSPDDGRVYLSASDPASVWMLEEPVTVDLEEVPVSATAALRAWPNPTVGSTRFSLHLDQSSRLVPGGGEGASALAPQLSLRDIAGRRVKQLSPSVTQQGLITYDWDARDRAGLPVSSGCYFVEVEGNPTLKAKLQIIR